MYEKQFQDYIDFGFIDTVFEVYVNRVHESFLTPPHTHDFIEINYVTEGRGYHYIYEKPVAVMRGDIFILPIGTTHMYRPYSMNEQNSLIVYNVIFPFDLVEIWSRSMPVPPQLNLFLKGNGHAFRQYTDINGNIALLFEQMYQEYIQKSPGYTSLLMTHVITLLIHLLRLEMNVITPPPIKVTKLDEVFHFIQTNYNKLITLSEAAEIACQSPSHFLHTFRKATGCTFLEYVQNIRIEKSCSLLRTSSMKVQHIAEAVGYMDVRFFQQLFKRKTGISPNEYRKRFSS